MFSRIFFAVILAGIVAGIVFATVQYFRTTPLIIAAEAFENGTTGHTGKNTRITPATTQANPADSRETSEWVPRNGFERTAYSVLVNIIIGIGLAMLLAGSSLITGIAITPLNGALWGLVAFAVFTLSPGAGLPPELPGFPAADLASRQTWWWATVLAAATGVGLIAVVQKYWAYIAGFALIALPHFIGAPKPADHHTNVPAHLVQTYVANSMFLMAVTWIATGLALGFSLNRLQQHGNGVGAA